MLFFQADAIIDLLMEASEHMSHHFEPATARRRHVHDVHTLLRVLCHKKDNSASTFLKIQYHLPRSSGAKKLVKHYCWCFLAIIKHIAIIFCRKTSTFQPWTIAEVHIPTLNFETVYFQFKVKTTCLRVLGWEVNFCNNSGLKSGVFVVFVICSLIFCFSPLISKHMHRRTGLILDTHSRYVFLVACALHL